MEQSLDLSALGGQQIDPETFRRVWARVMPNQENSPIVVEPPASAAAPAQTASSKANVPPKMPNRVPMAPQTAAPAPKPSPGAAPRMPPKKMPQTVPTPSQPKAAVPRPEERAVPPQPAQKKAETRSDEEWMRRLMDLAQEGMAGSQMLARRAGNQGKALSGLAADHRRALRQLAAAYFLATGRRYQPRGTTPVRNNVLILALREQFLWEQQWARICLQTAAEAVDQDLRDLCRELAQDAALHTRAIRGVLERI